MENTDITSAVGDVELDYKLNGEPTLFTISWVNFKSALIYGLLSAIVAVGVYAISIGDVFAIQSHALINAFFFGFSGTFISLVKNFLTDNNGNFLGAVKVIPQTPKETL